MRRIFKFLKISGKDVAIAVGCTSIVAAALLVAGALFFGILYGVGFFGNSIFFGGAPMTTEEYAASGFFSLVFVGAPCYLIFIIGKFFLFICRWIYNNWNISGAGQ